MISNLTLFASALLFGLIAGQAPVPNGRDSFFFEPLLPAPLDNPFVLNPPDFPDAEGPVQTPPPSSSSPQSPCSLLQIRSLTGICTHQVDPTLGQARRPHFSYFNVDSREIIGQRLKSARVISNLVSPQSGDVFNSRGLNELLVFFGQFIDHNIAATPLSDEEAEIEAPPGSNERFPFKRSLRARTGQGEAERPVNILPSAIDLVAVYGPNEMRNRALREPNSCKLKTSEGDLLPFNTEGFSNAPSNSSEFYFAGDQRANEHPVLASLHTLWVREHNFLCDAIAPKFPSFTQENLYETARAINVAQFQKVVFEEFYPALTGQNLPAYTGFNPSVNPTLSSLFSTAAFRVGHTMIGDVLTKIDEDGSTTRTSLHENFFVPGALRDGIESTLRGAAKTIAQEIDVLVVDSLRNFLFEGLGIEEEGPDLIALNLQRGRDHNIPSFNEIRKEFGLLPRTRFSRITANPFIQNRLARAYDDVNDVEAWIGLVAEDKMRGSSFGETLFRVWRREFLRLRDGDQFFYLGDRAISNNVRASCPELVDPIMNPGVKLFRDIVVRNTDISQDELNTRAFLR